MASRWAAHGPSRRNLDCTRNNASRRALGFRAQSRQRRSRRAARQRKWRRGQGVAGVEFFARYGQGRIAALQRDTATARIRFEQALAAPARNLDAAGGIYLELARLAAASGDVASMRRLINAVITAEAIAGATGSAIERAALELLRSRPGL